MFSKMPLLKQKTKNQAKSDTRTACILSPWMAAWFGFYALLISGLLVAAARSEPSPNPKSSPLINAIFVSAAGTQYRDALRVDRFCRELRNQPFDAVILQVRYEAEALYNSQLMPKALGVEASFDPLAVVIKQLHAPEQIGKLESNGKPKKVIAWFDPYTLPNAKNPAGINPQNVAKLHQDWLSVRADGTTADADGNQFLEPGLADVQLHLQQLIAELVKQYQIDGLLIDNVGDPPGDGRWGLHPAVIKQWQQAGGSAQTPEPHDPAWIQFRAELFTQVAGGLTHAAHEARPGLPVALEGDASGPAPASAEQFPTSSVYMLRRQDWPLWLGQGLCDQFILKNYRAERAAADDFDNWLKLAMAAAAPRGVKVVNAVSGQANESVDALSQLRRSAALGASGVALCDFETPVSDTGARELFMTAVAHAVLSPEPPRLRPQVPEALAAQTSGTTPASADGTAASPNEPLRLTPILRAALHSGSNQPEPKPPTEKPTEKRIASTSGEPTPAGSNSSESGERLDVPPPPPLAEVLDEGNGELIPAQPGGSATVNSIPTVAAAQKTTRSQGRIALPPVVPPKGTDATWTALNKLAARDSSSNATYPTPAPGASANLDKDYVTRRQMIGEILSATENQSIGGERFFTADPQSQNELHKKFGNIF